MGQEIMMLWIMLSFRPQEHQTPGPRILYGRVGKWTTRKQQYTCRSPFEPPYALWSSKIDADDHKHAFRANNNSPLPICLFVFRRERITTSFSLIREMPMRSVPTCLLTITFSMWWSCWLRCYSCFCPSQRPLPSPFSAWTSMYVTSTSLCAYTTIQNCRVFF